MSSTEMCAAARAAAHVRTDPSIEEMHAALAAERQARCRAEEELERWRAEAGDARQRLKQSIVESSHRVKNQLQVLAGLVDLLAMRDAEAVPRSELARIAQHIRALALVHDLLTVDATQEVDDLGASVSFEALVEKMLPALAPMVGGRPFACEVTDVRLTVRQASSLAMLLSELVSNATKHGSGGVYVTFRVGGGLGQLEVCDDGPGFPEGFDPRAAANTGLSLVESLGRWDLRGEVLYGNRDTGGAQAVVRMPLVASTVANSG